MKLLYSFICIMSIGVVAAQMNGNIRVEGLGNVSSGDLSSEMLSKIRSIGKTNASSLKANGSPYMNDDFQKTRLFYEDSLQGTVFYRFNAYNQEVEIAPNNIGSNELNALSKDKKIALEVNGNKMSFKTFITDKNKTINGYLISLLDGDTYDLYKRVHVIYSPGRPAANSFVSAVPNRLTHFTEYYAQQTGVDRIDNIPLHNGKFIKKLDKDMKVKVKEFIKMENLNIKNEADLVKVFQFLNQ